MPMDRRMLDYLGLQDVEQLFDDIPEDVRMGRLDLPEGLSEPETVRTIREMLRPNVTAEDMPCFLGGGVYNHFIPAAVRSIISRSEFITSYTPYQSEISQGMLQILFEYQSMMSRLTGMEVVNSSNYDCVHRPGRGGHHVLPHTPRRKFLIPEAMSWEKRSVLRNYTAGLGMEIVEYAYDPYTGGADLDDLRTKFSEEVCGIYVEVPNLFGVIDPIAPKLKSLFPDVVLVVGVNPISLGVVTPPGEYGADIVIGEGQLLGSPMNFGGPLLGIFAVEDGACAEDAWTPHRHDQGRLGATGLLHDPADPGTAHPSGQGHVQHLHQRGADGRGRGRLPGHWWAERDRELAAINIAERQGADGAHRRDPRLRLAPFRGVPFQRVRHQLAGAPGEAEQAPAQARRHRRDAPAGPCAPTWSTRCCFAPPRCTPTRTMTG